ncbi:MAG: hypothetical protein J5950_04405 [Clostridia bacterium]|nr:hypothetical protein [Clostridia bacterium]
MKIKSKKLIKAAVLVLTALLVAASFILLAGCTRKAEESGGIQFSELFDTGDKYGYTVTLVPVLSCPGKGEYKIAQGAASDGVNAYFVMRQEENGDCIICKYSLKTKKLLKTSAPIHLFHGNDMTYDSKTGLLYVAHGSSEGKILTSVDPKTLTVAEQTIDIEKGSGAITYSAERDMFAISQGGKKLHFLDGELNWISSFDRVDNTGYTAQGMGSDEKYVYFPMSSSDSNFIVVYDWEGNFVDQFLLDFAWESESMFWVNGTYYIAFNHDGAAELYRMEISKR